MKAKTNEEPKTGRSRKGSRRMSPISRIFLAVMAGVLAAIVAWPATLPSLPDDFKTDFKLDASRTIGAALRGSGPPVTRDRLEGALERRRSYVRMDTEEAIRAHFCLGTYYGWMRNLLFGGVGAWFIIYVLTLGKPKRQRIRAMVVGALIGGPAVTLGHALKDWATIQWYISMIGESPAAALNNDSFAPSGFVLIMDWLMEPLGLCAAIVLAMGVTRTRLRQAALAVLMAAFGGKLIWDGVCLAFYLLMNAINVEHNAWLDSALAFLAGHIYVGAVVGGFMALAEFILLRAWLERTYAAGEIDKWYLVAPVTRLGAAEDVDIRFPREPGMVPVHAQIEGSDGTYSVRDLGGGVCLNGSPTGTSALADGDIILLGQTRLVFRLRPPFGSVGSLVHSWRRFPVKLVEPDDFVSDSVFARKMQTAYAPREVPATTCRPVLDGWNLVDEFGNRHALHGEVVVVGSAPGSDLRLEWEATLSARHAEISALAAGPAVIDLGSSDGTKVNGTAVGPAPAKLGEGDTVEFGRARMTLRRVPGAMDA